MHFCIHSYLEDRCLLEIGLRRQIQVHPRNMFSFIGMPQRKAYIEASFRNKQSYGRIHQTVVVVDVCRYTDIPNVFGFQLGHEVHLDAVGLAMHRKSNNLRNHLLPSMTSN